MKNLIIFLLFILYATVIFFLPNNWCILCAVLVNFLAMLFTKSTWKLAFFNLLHFLPFILLTVVINFLLGYHTASLWIGIKLLLVCNITFIYSRTTTTMEVAKTIHLLCTPLKLLKINTEEIEVLVCISLSMIPVLKKELSEVKEACKAKSIKLNIQNTKLVLSKLLISFLRRINEIDEALMEKGYDY